MTLKDYLSASKNFLIASALGSTLALSSCTPMEARRVFTDLAIHGAREHISNRMNPRQTNINIYNNGTSGHENVSADPSVRLRIFEWRDLNDNKEIDSGEYAELWDGGSIDDLGYNTIAAVLSFPGEAKRNVTYRSYDSQGNKIGESVVFENSSSLHYADPSNNKGSFVDDLYKVAKKSPGKYSITAKLEGMLYSTRFIVNGSKE